MSMGSLSGPINENFSVLKSYVNFGFVLIIEVMNNSVVEGVTEMGTKRRADDCMSSYLQL